MMAWRDKDLSGLEPATVNGYLSTVFRMYLWAEKNGYVRGLIGEPDLANNIHPGLSVEVSFDRRGTRKQVSPLLTKTFAKPVLPTPTNEEITKVHEALAEEYDGNLELMVRDALILTWAELSGTRRMEVLSLKRKQIPPWSHILELEETGEKEEITITGKGGKRRSLWVGADLLTQTREYIEVERHVLFSRWRKSRGSNYKNPEEIFVSSKTGRRLCEDSVSQKFAIAFRKAGVRGSIHRVRARFLTNLIEYAIERELEALGAIPDATSVLLPIAQLAGHTHVETLASYFAIGKKRLLRQTVAERTAVAQERAIGAERRSSTNQLRLKHSTEALKLFRALLSGNKRKLQHAIQELCEAQGIDLSQLVYTKTKPKRSRLNESAARSSL